MAPSKNSSTTTQQQTPLSLPETIILSNQVLCLECGDAPFSASRHNYKSCKCGNVAVDGGTSYLKRNFKSERWKDISIEWDLIKYNRIRDIIDPHLSTARWLEEPSQAAAAVDTICDLWVEFEGLGNHMREPLLKAICWAIDNNRNTYGLICAMARTERDGDFYI